MEEECTFCRLLKGNKVASNLNDFWWMSWDRFPVTPGHAEMIPKRHVESIEDLEESEERLFFPSLKQVIDVIRHTDLRILYTDFYENPINEKSKEFCMEALTHPALYLGPMHDYNIGINNGPLAGRTVHHLHVHIIPRYQGDVEDPVGGVRGVIPGKRNYK